VLVAPAFEPRRLYRDFCSASDPGWVIETDQDFKIIKKAPDGSSLLENFTGGWAACEQCARSVSTGQKRFCSHGPWLPSPRPARRPR